MAEKVKVVAATGAAGPTKSNLGKRMEDAMSQAILDAAKEGITDPNKVRARMLAARDAVRGS